MRVQCEYTYGCVNGQKEDSEEMSKNASGERLWGGLLGPEAEGGVDVPSGLQCGAQPALGAVSGGEPEGEAAPSCGRRD